jgi:proline utilization trans-activator
MISPPRIGQWPTEEQAQALVDTVIASIGNIQHLFDARSFSDRLAAVYDLDDTIFRDDVSTAEILMVFAVGRLLQGSLDKNESFPGYNFFSEALKYVQNLFSVHAAGAQGVEVMGLIAFYLQCADRKEDAYIYVSTESLWLSAEHVANDCRLV